MKVRVKESQVESFFGFYGTLRRYPGDEFTLTDDKHFSEKWMEKMEEPKRSSKKVLEAS